MEEDTSSMNNDLMNNTKYIPSSSKSEITDVKVCKSCDKSFDECKILKHITHASCGEKYTKEEINMLRKLAKERSTRKKLEQRHKKRKMKLESDILASIEVCRSCNRTFTEESILKHINHSESCMKDYSDEDMGFLRFWADERKKDLEVDYWTINDDRKQQNNADYWESNKESLATKRKEKSVKEKISKQGLLEMCKSCKKKMGEKSILKHLGQKESCRKDYDEDDMEYLRNWADKRNRSKKSSYYERNKLSIISEKSLRYKKKKEGNSQKRD